MAIVGAGESGSITSRLGRCIAIFKGSHPCKRSEIVYDFRMCCPTEDLPAEIISNDGARSMPLKEILKGSRCITIRKEQ